MYNRMTITAHHNPFKFFFLDISRYLYNISRLQIIITFHIICVMMKLIATYWKILYPTLTTFISKLYYKFYFNVCSFFVNIFKILYVSSFKTSFTGRNNSSLSSFIFMEIRQRLFFFTFSAPRKSMFSTKSFWFSCFIDCSFFYSKSLHSMFYFGYRHIEFFGKSIWRFFIYPIFVFKKFFCEHVYIIQKNVISVNRVFMANTFQYWGKIALNGYVASRLAEANKT